MEFMKIGGRYVQENATIYTALTMTDGFVNVNGEISPSTAYTYSQPIPVQKGCVINVVLTGNISSLQSVRVITAYKNNVVVPEAGWNPGSASTESYTVPDGVDSIVITTPKRAASQSSKMVGTVISAKGLRTDDSGALFTKANGVFPTKHIWEVNPVTIINNEPVAYGTPVVSTALDVSEYAFVSLRVQSTVDAPIFIRFLTDITSGGSQWLSLSDGEDYFITIPNGNNSRVITLDDVPLLGALKYLKLRINTSSSGATGNVTVIAMCKR